MTMEIGTCNALLRGVKTMIDGSVKVELEINPEDRELIAKLIKQYIDNKRLLAVAFVGIE
jgi:hypothetical protein